jgi:hypothetical protein
MDRALQLNKGCPLWSFFVAFSVRALLGQAWAVIAPRSDLML